MPQSYNHTGSLNGCHVGAGGEDLSGASDIRQWIVALYFAMTTVTTVGYGDITAHSAVEQVSSDLLESGLTVVLEGFTDRRMHVRELSLTRATDVIAW